MSFGWDSFIREDLALFGGVNQVSRNTTAYKYYCIQILYTNTIPVWFCTKILKVS